jgi:AcrR family transcriptional regulator
VTNLLFSPPDEQPVAESSTPSSAAAPAGSGRGDARRRAMIEAAAELFLERGYEKTSLGDVVRRSGGSLATLYAAFGSKEGLFEAIVAEISEQILSEFAAPELESQSLDQALQLFGERFLGMILCPNALRWHRMCLAEGHQFPALREALLRSGPGRVRDRLADYLSVHARSGRLRLDDPGEAAGHFIALLKSEILLAAVCGDPVDLSTDRVAHQASRAVDVFLHGYSAESPSRPRASRSSARTSKANSLLGVSK